MKKFRDHPDWSKRHLAECAYVAPVFRSSVSRTYRCFYSIATSRCMYRLCPLKADEHRSPYSVESMKSRIEVG